MRRISSHLSLRGAGLALAALVAPVSGHAATDFAVMHDFNGIDAQGRKAGLIADGAGNLLGTSEDGGALKAGTVYRLPPEGGRATVLHVFGGPGDGSDPAAALVMGPNGALYGTTVSGGPSGGVGTVFQLVPPVGNITMWRYNILHTFETTDGANPYSRLAIDRLGALYGTTGAGGKGHGTVFKLAPPREGLQAWGFEVLYTFRGGLDGAEPRAGVIADGAGNLYGTTAAGGGTGDGTLYELLPAVMPGGPWTETVLHSFKGGPADGRTADSELYRDASGRIYGTTRLGGRADLGTIYMLVPAVMPGGPWTETLLHEFQATNPADGALPSQGVVPGPNGALYGTTVMGGANDEGTIYKLLPAVRPVETVLHSFSAKGDGAEPSYAALLAGPTAVYGTTFDGGTENDGTLFRLTE